jgi:hypothetical protein
MDGWLDSISALGWGGVVATGVYCGKMHLDALVADGRSLGCFVEFG